MTATATTTILSIDRAKKIAKFARAFVQNTFESKIPLKIMQDVLAEGFGFDRWEGLRAACGRDAAVEWDPRSFARSMDANSGSDMPKAATDAMILLIERLLDRGTALSDDVNRAVLRFPFDLGNLAEWAPHLPALVRKAGFADLLGFVIERAADRLASYELEDENEQYMDAVFAATRPDIDPATDENYAAARLDLAVLAGRPAHPAWPAVVLAALSLTVTPHAPKHARALSEHRATPYTILFGVMAFAFTAYGADIPMEWRLSGVESSLYQMPPNQAEDLRDTISMSVGAALLQMRMGYVDAGIEPPDLAMMPDLARPAVALPPAGAAPGTETYDEDLGAPIARGWIPLRRPDNGLALEGQWHRVLVDGAEAEAMLSRIDPQQERKSPAFGDFSTGADFSRTAHVVGFGAYPDAVAPALMVVTTRFVRKAGAHTVVTIAVEDVLGGPALPDTAIDATFFSLHEIAKADADRLKRSVEISAVDRGSIRIEYKLAPFATRFDRLLNLIDDFAYTTTYDASSGNEGPSPAPGP